MTLLLLLTASLESAGQQPVFSQFYASGTYLNPALAGLEKDIVVGLNYRSQWSSIEIPYSTFQLSYIHPLIKKSARPKHVGGIGISVLNDVTGSSGEFKLTGVNFSGAYDYHLNRYGNNIISFGIQAGIYQKSIDPSAFQWSSQYSSLLGYDGSVGVGEFPDTEQRTFLGLNAGFVWTYQQSARYSRREFGFYQGLSFANINRPQQSVYTEGDATVPVTIRLHGGMDIFLTKQFSISPNYLAQMEGEFHEINAGAYLSYYVTDRISDSPTVITGGTWYRVGDGVILSMGLIYNQFRFGFSYDRNISSMRRYFGNVSAFELSLQFSIRRSRGMKRYNTPMI